LKFKENTFYYDAFRYLTIRLLNIIISSTKYILVELEQTLIGYVLTVMVAQEKDSRFKSNKWEINCGLKICNLAFNHTVYEL